MRKNNISKIVTVLAFVFGIIFLGLESIIFLGIMILGEIPNLLQAIGGAICLTGILIVQKSNPV